MTDLDSYLYRRYHGDGPAEQEEHSRTTCDRLHPNENHEQWIKARESRFDTIEGVTPQRPLVLDTSGPFVDHDISHDDDSSPTMNYMAEQAEMVAGQKVTEFHVYWNEDHGQWEIGDCPNG